MCCRNNQLSGVEIISPYRFALNLHGKHQQNMFHIWHAITILHSYATEIFFRNIRTKANSQVSTLSQQSLFLCFLPALSSLLDKFQCLVESSYSSSSHKSLVHFNSNALLSILVLSILFTWLNHCNHFLLILLTNL
jgi:hypothetical protein